MAYILYMSATYKGYSHYVVHDTVQSNKEHAYLTYDFFPTHNLNILSQDDVIMAHPLGATFSDDTD